MYELIEPIQKRFRVSFFGRKLILQYAYKRPIDNGGWDIKWKDAKYIYEGKK